MLLFILITCLLDIVLILWGEILSWSFKGVKRFITLKSKISSMLLNVIKKPHKVVTNNKGNNTSTNLQRKELKINWLHGSLYICDVNYITEVYNLHAPYTCAKMFPVDRYPWRKHNIPNLFHKTLRLGKLFCIAILINLRVFLVFYINEVRHNCSKKKHEKELRKSCQVSLSSCSNP